MPSILFVMKYPLHYHDNLQAKFDGQMEAARTLGWDAYCIGWDKHGMYLLGAGTKTKLFQNKLAGFRGYDHTKVFMDLMKAVQIVISRVKVDVLYLRYMPTFLNAPLTLRKYKATGGKLIVEYPTYPIAQENNRFFLRRQVFRYADHVMGKIRPMVDLYTVIGEDCGGMLYGKPAINIVNGVNIHKLTQHMPRTEQQDIRLLALASMSGWHGYDRIIESLAAYNGSADVRIAFVGDDGDGSLARWKQLAQDKNVLNSITFYGAQYGDALEKVIADSDLGIGSLGMFRYGLQQGMTLKAREFMGRGLPFISAVEDPALPKDKGYFLQVKNDETPIDLSSIVQFARLIKRNTTLPVEMRAYTEKNLSWQSVFSTVFKRLKL